MRRIFDMDSPLMRGITRFADLMFLNLLTLLCCVPIVTIGAALAALYGAVGRMQREEGHTFSNYFQCFKENFRQATCLWLILLPILALLILALGYYTGDNLEIKALSSAGGIVSLAGILIWSMIVSWVFPLQSRFVNTVKGTLRNAAICSIAFLWKTLIMTVLNLLPWVLFLAWPPMFMAFALGFALVYFSLIASINLRLLKKSFSSLHPDEEHEEDTYEEEEDV